MQIIIIGSVVMITAYFMAQFISNADRSGMRVIHRNDNLNIATSLSDYVNDHNQISNAGSVVDQDAVGNPVTYP